MGTLLHERSGVRSSLSARTLIGRASGCDLTIPRRQVSGDHARLEWRDGAWTIRDLGSRNGTFVGGDRLEPGAGRALAAGDALAFGDREDRWVLEDAAPPVALARPVEGGADRLAEGELLALPSDEAPVAVLHRGLDGAWVVERDGDARPARDQEILQIDGAPWQILLPDAVEGTLAATASRAVGALKLRFAVSLDEEHVQLTAIWRGQEIDLGARAHNYMLLTLARQRLDDAELDLSERGWMYREVLDDGLRLEPNHLNLMVYRARKAFARAGIDAGAALIERRLDTGQLRLGVSAIEVVRG